MKIDPIRSFINHRYSSHGLKRKLRPDSKLSSVRIERIIHSKVSKINYAIKSKKAHERIRTVKSKRFMKANIKAKQTRIRTTSNLTRANFFRKERKKKLKKKFREKFQKNFEEEEKQIEFDRNVKIKKFRNWQKEWIKFLLLKQFVNGFQAQVNDLDDYKKVFFMMQAKKQIWKINRCNKLIKKMPVRHKFLFAWAGLLLKRKVRQLREKKRMKFATRYTILASIRKKVRIGVSRYINRGIQ